MGLLTKYNDKTLMRHNKASKQNIKVYKKSNLCVCIKFTSVYQVELILRRRNSIQISVMMGLL